jgi:DNA sulfur modification protein DndB
MMETYFYGDLVQNKELGKVAKQRKKKYQEITVLQAEQSSLIEQGWEIKRELKNRVRLIRKKKCDELLEDELWLLFNNSGFTEMSKDRNFKIQAGPIKKQIDIFAKDENNAFIIECKASVENVQISRKDIHEISDLKKDITDTIKKKYDDRSIHVSFVIATRGIRWTDDDKELAKNNRIFVWKEAELEYYGDLIKHLANSAKYQLYSILFPNKKIYELKNIKIPAIRGGRGKIKYYSFIIQPKKLLHVAYIHHRRSTPEELLGSYQRMLKKARLEKIDKFISAGGYFPNNIILNFTKSPIFEKRDEEGDIAYGILKFPPYYASAWVIDGQHRLYGYANNEKKSRDTVPVLAFDSLDIKEQAKLFVEINKEQKAVSSNLLWDLFSDIYHDSKEEKQQVRRTISLIVKKLNSCSDSPLREHISIPSSPTKGKKITNLTIATLCDGIEENRFINKEEGLFYERNYSSTVDFSSERFKAYFNVIAESFPEDWNKGDDGVLRTNIGIRILFVILRQLLKYLNLKYKSKEKIYRKQNLSEFRDEIAKLLKPTLSKLKDMSDEQRSKIRKQTGKGPLVENAKQMVWWIKEEFNGFGLELLRDWAPSLPSEESDEIIDQLLEDTEKKLRSFIAKELRKYYGGQWWRPGIPDDVRKYIKE